MSGKTVKHSYHSKIFQTNHGEIMLKKTTLSAMLGLICMPALAQMDKEKAQIAYEKAIGFGNAIYCDAQPLYDKPLNNVFLLEQTEEGSAYAVIYSSTNCSTGRASNSFHLTPVYFNHTASDGFVIISEEKEYDLLTISGENINTSLIDKVSQNKSGNLEIISAEYREENSNGNIPIKVKVEVKLPEMSIIKKTDLQ